MNLDLNILLFIQEHIKCEFLDYIMAFFSYIGNYGALWLLIAIVLLFKKDTRYYGILLLISISIAWVIGDVILKPLIARSRPFYNYDVIMNIPKPHGFSFPSGHSASSFVSAFIIYKLNKKFGIIAYFVASLIAFSRLYNFVHYPSDVICGIILGLITSSLIYYSFKKYFKKHDIMLN